jgi:arginine:ornithine antiporter/lysine permease
MTTVLIQVMLLVALVSDDAFNFMLNMTSALTLIPFLLAAAYALKLVLPRDIHGRRGGGPDARPGRRRAGHAVHRVPAVRRGTEVHARLVHHLRPRQRAVRMARREQGRQPFTPTELVILAVS